MSLKTNSSAFELKQGRRRFLLRLSWTGLGLFLTTFLAAGTQFFLAARARSTFQILSSWFSGRLSARSGGLLQWQKTLYHP